MVYKLHQQKGFTLIEMLVIAPIVVLAVGAFLTVIISMTGEVLSSRGSNALAYDVQDAMNRIEADVKLSTGYLATNNIALTTGGQQGYNNDDTSNFTNVGGTSGTSLVLSELVTNGNPLSTSSGIVYLADKPNACGSASISDNTPMTMNVIYFVKNDPNNNNTPTLWRRTIMPSNYATPAARCSTPWQQPSCAPGYTSTFCKTNDIKLVAGVAATSFVLQYYTNSSATLPNATASDTGATTDNRNAALASSPTVGVSIAASQTVAGRPIDRSATLRTTRLDTNSTVVASTAPDTTPAAPLGMAATFISPGQITASWYANGAASYTLQYDTTGAFSAPTTISNITTSSRTITGLLGAPRYYFRVLAVNSLGSSAYSSTADSWSTIANGLVGWYRLNGNGNDDSGTTTNATITGATTATGQNGQSSGAYAFNGTSAQYGTINSPFGLINTSITITTWVNNPTATNSGAFVKVGTNNGYGIGIGSSQFDYNTTGTNIVMLFEGIRWIPTTTALGTGWHHVAMVIDSAGTPSAYRDGVFVGSYPGSAAITPTTTSYLASVLTSSNARWFNGTMDDVRVYNRALSASEIQSLYTAGAQ